VTALAARGNGIRAARTATAARRPPGVAAHRPIVPEPVPQPLRAHYPNLWILVRYIPFVELAPPGWRVQHPRAAPWRPEEEGV